jgi:hypothetical protein
MLPAVYQEPSAAPTNILAVLVSALECSDSYEITEHRGELFITRLDGHYPPYRQFARQEIGRPYGKDSGKVDANATSR